MGPRHPPPFTSALMEEPGVLILWPQGPQLLLLSPALQVQIPDPTVSSQGQALGPHGALPVWRPPPLLKSERKLLLEAREAHYPGESCAPWSLLKQGLSCSVGFQF